MASAQIKLRNGGKEAFGSMRSDHGSCFKFIFVCQTERPFMHQSTVLDSKREPDT